MHRNYLSTMRKQGHAMLAALAAVFAGQPFPVAWDSYAFTMRLNLPPLRLRPFGQTREAFRLVSQVRETLRLVSRVREVKRASLATRLGRGVASKGNNPLLRGLRMKKVETVFLNLEAIELPPLFDVLS
jgi:hypothetical protein